MRALLGVSLLRMMLFIALAYFGLFRCWIFWKSCVSRLSRSSVRFSLWVVCGRGGELKIAGLEAELLKYQAGGGIDFRDVPLPVSPGDVVSSNQMMNPTTASRESPFVPPDAIKFVCFGDAARSALFQNPDNGEIHYIRGDQPEDHYVLVGTGRTKDKKIRGQRLEAFETMKADGEVVELMAEL